jgi:hypothetical protein
LNDAVPIAFGHNRASREKSEIGCIGVFDVTRKITIFAAKRIHRGIVFCNLANLCPHCRRADEVLADQHTAHNQADDDQHNTHFDEREPTTHLGPAATEIERRGEQSKRGDMNREAQAVNTLIEERNAVETEIALEREQLSNPPMTREEERERIRAGVEPFTESIKTHGELPEKDGLTWWQRAALQISMKARSFAQVIASKAKGLWQDRFGKDRDDRKDRDERGLGLDQDPDDERGFDR